MRLNMKLADIGMIKSIQMEIVTSSIFWLIFCLCALKWTFFDQLSIQSDWKFLDNSEMCAQRLMAYGILE